MGIKTKLPCVLTTVNVYKIVHYLNVVITKQTNLPRELNDLAFYLYTAPN